MLSLRNFLKLNSTNIITKAEDPSVSQKKKSFNIDEEFLANIINKTDFNLDNITESLLKSSLWPSLQPYNMGEQTENIQQRPEYIVVLILCIFALITNIVSIIAVSHIRHSLTTHLKLIINLAISDIVIIISVLLQILNKISNNSLSPLSLGYTNPNSRLLNSCFFSSINALNIVSFLIVLINLLVMAVDHYIAIMKPLRYPYIMSRRNGYILIMAMWIFATLGGFSNFIIGYIGYHPNTPFNICEYIMYDSYHAEFLIFGVTIICLFAITFIYTRIFYEVRRIQAKMPTMPNITLHNTKALITTLVIIGTFIICWLPNCVFQLTMIVQIQLNKRIVYKLFSTYSLVSKYLYILQLTNCLLDPIIYAVRLKIVKQGYRNFLKRIRNSYNRTKVFICKTNLLGTQTSRRGTITPVPTEIVSDLMQQIGNSTDDANSESVNFFKPTEDSDVNYNELVPMVTFCNATERDREPNLKYQKYIAKVTVHNSGSCNTNNENGSLLQNEPLSTTI